MRIRGCIGWSHEEFDHLLQSDHASAYAKSGAIRGIRLFGLHHGWNAAMPHTIVGQNLHDELAERRA